MHEIHSFGHRHVCFTQSWDLRNLRIVPEEIVVDDMCKVAISAM